MTILTLVTVVAVGAAHGASASSPAPSGALTLQAGGLSHLRGVGDVPLVTTSPDGRSVYVTGTPGIAVLARDPATGRLSQLPGAAGCARPDRRDGCTRIAGLRTTGSSSLSPDGRSLYAATIRGVATLRRDPATGALSGGGCRGTCTRLAARLTPTTVLATDGAVYVAGSVARRGEAAGGAIAVLARDPATGALTPAGCVSRPGGGGCARAPCLDSEHALALSADGHALYDATTDSLDPESTGTGSLASLRRDPATGALRYVGCALSPNAFAGIVAVPGSDAMLVSTLNGDRGTGREFSTISRYRPGSSGRLRRTALLACAGNSDPCGSRIGYDATNLALTPDGRTLYASSADTGIAAGRVGASHLAPLPGRAGCVAGVRQPDPPTGCARVGPQLGGALAIAPDGRTLLSLTYRGGRPGIEALAIVP